MLTFNKTYDGLNVMIRLREHSYERTHTRAVNNNDIETMIDAAADVLFFVSSLGMEINLVDESKNITLCIGVNEDFDHNIVLDVITVIDAIYRHPYRNNIIIKKNTDIELSGLLKGKLPVWF